MLLNNLATALSSDPRAEQHALTLLDRAVKLVGRETPELLDTRASILMHRNPEKAEAIYRTLENEQADPRITLQLAVALQRQGETAESLKYLQAALDRGLQDYVLTPAQRQQLERLEKTTSSGHRVGRTDDQLTDEQSASSRLNTQTNTPNESDLLGTLDLRRPGRQRLPERFWIEKSPAVTATQPKSSRNRWPNCRPNWANGRLSKVAIWSVKPS